MRSKDPCGECSEGRMLVTCTRRVCGGRRLRRFLRCTDCGAMVSKFSTHHIPDLVRTCLAIAATAVKMTISDT